MRGMRRGLTVTGWGISTPFLISVTGDLLISGEVRVTTKSHVLTTPQ